MPIFDRFLYRELVLNLLFTFVLITFVFLVGGTVSMLYRSPELPLLLFAQAIPIQLLRGLSFVLPLSMLIAVVFVYGRMAADNEITTVKASGVHPYRLLVPALVLGVLLSVVGAWIGTEWSPRADYHVRNLLKQGEALEQVFQRTLGTGRRHLALSDELILQWEEVEFPDVVLRDLLIRTEGRFLDERQSGSDMVVIRAGSARPRVDERSNTLFLDLEDVEWLEGGPVEGARIGKVPLRYSLGPLRGKTRMKYYTGQELSAMLRRSREGLHAAYGPRAIAGEIHSRYALATSSLVFVLLGAPLALVFRSGNRMVAFLLSFLIGLFVYYPSFLLARTLGDENILHPVVAAWSGNSLMVVLGAGMLLFVVRR